MSPMQQALLMIQAPSGPAPLTLPYTIDFNGYSSYTEMVAGYAEVGIVISTTLPLQTGEPNISNGIYYGTVYGEDNDAPNIPYSPQGAKPKTPYLFCNFFENVYVQRSLTIAIPPGTPAKRVSWDNWRNTTRDYSLEITYSDTTVVTVELTYTDGTDAPFFLQTAVPGFPPGGTSYITQIRFIGPITFGLRFAVDNIIFTE